MLTNTDNLSIVLYPHPTLRKPTILIESIDDNIVQIAHKMLDIMRQAPGIGLAAPQVGLPLRMFVANTTGEIKDDLVYINPVLTNPTTDSVTFEEGCLSFPGIYAHIMRPTGITITALDLNGNEFTQSSNDILARIWQHETDHLNATLFIDRFTQTDKLANRRLLKTLEDNYSL